MMKTFKAPRLALAALMAGTFLLSGTGVMLSVDPAYAQRAGGDDDEQQKRKTRQSQVIRDEKLGKVMNEAVELLNAEGKEPDLKAIYAVLERAPALDKLSSYERSKLALFRGQILAQMERYKDSIVQLQLALKEEDIDETDKSQTYFTLAQLYMVTEQFQAAIGLLEDWFKTANNPNPTAYFLLCQGYLQIENYKKAIEPCVTTINTAREREIELLENWVRAVIIVYQQTNDLEKATDWVKYAFTNWPKRDYWIQYVSMLSQRGLEQQELSAYEIAYRMGYLTRETEVVRLAQMYQYHQVPYKSVKVLEKGIKDGIVEENRKNLELLANVYTLARESEDAVDPLQKAATLANEGPLWERLAQVYIQDEEWAKAANALDKAIRAGGLSNQFRTRVLEGMTLANSGKFDEAREKFKDARRATDETREKRQIDAWLRYVDDEQRRTKDIATYNIKKYGTGAR